MIINPNRHPEPNDSNARGLARTQVLLGTQPAKPALEQPRPRSFDCASFMRSLRISALS